MAADTLKLMDALDIEAAHLVGHSTGGAIGQIIAQDAGHRLKSLVLSATSPAFGKAGGDWQQEFLAARLAPLDTGKTPADLAPAIVEALVADGAAETAKAAAIASMSRISPDAYRAALTCLVTFDRREALANIKVPTLAIAGEHDTTAPPKVVARMADAIRGARYVLLPGVGHLANVENPTAYNAALGDFFASLTTTDSE